MKEMFHRIKVELLKILNDVNTKELEFPLRTQEILSHWIKVFVQT